MTKEELDALQQIAHRAVRLWKQFGHHAVAINVAMDVLMVHCLNKPLRLKELFEADNFNFMHDIVGIYDNLDRKTGKLSRIEPRFSSDRPVREPLTEPECVVIAALCVNASPDDDQHPIISSILRKIAGDALDDLTAPNTDALDDLTVLPDGT